MKRFLAILTLAVFAIGLVGCNNTNDEFKAPDVIDMTNIDEYLNVEEIQYVDLRNFSDQLSAGWIMGFDFIPYFDFLEYSDILVRTPGSWAFEAGNIKNEAAMKSLFNKDKHIVLMCASGARAGFVKAALEHLGYENVYNAGGIKDYKGTNKILGDASYKIKPVAPVVTSYRQADVFVVA